MGSESPREQRTNLRVILRSGRRMTIPTSVKLAVRQRDDGRYIGGKEVLGTGTT